MKCPEQGDPQRQEVDLWLPGAGVTGNGGGLLVGLGFLLGGWGKCLGFGESCGGTTLMKSGHFEHCAAAAEISCAPLPCLLLVLVVVW